MKKRLLIPIMALAVFCLAVFTACGGPSVEDLIRDDLTTQFDAVKEGDAELIEALEASAGEDMETLGIDSAEFAGAFLDGFDYSIDDIVVDGDTATATVTVSCKSMTEVMTDFQDQFYDMLNNLDPSSVESEDDLYLMAGDLLMDAMSAAEVHETECEFVYNNDGEGNWSADASASTELMNALM